ncbi:MAG: CBS domain-containing protein [Phycisphaeraceae bacterium]|nr:CBS domain-containing protein [Phycisphaeraceae bacterium]
MLTVKEIMSRPVVTVDMDARLSEIRDVFERERFHHVLVVDHDTVVGIISDRDLLKRLSPFAGNKLNERKQDENTLNLKAHQIMTRNPVAVGPDDSVQSAVDLILRHNFRSLPVVDERKRPVGILSWKDIIRWGSFHGVWRDHDEVEPTLFDLDGIEESEGGAWAA